MKKLLLLTCAMLSIYIGKAQSFNANLAAKLQYTLDSICLQTSNAKGVSAALYYPGQGVWAGTWGESYVGKPLTTDMEFGIASNTKLFVAATIMKLVESNVLSLSDQLKKWLPKYKNVDSSITIKQLLNHTSGIASNSSTILDSVAAYPSRVFSLNEVLSWLGPKVYNPGGGFNYSNVNYVLASMVAESATGYHISKLIRDSILIPQHLDSTYYGYMENILGPIAHPWVKGIDCNDSSRVGLLTADGPAGAIYSKPSQMVKWYQALLSGQVVNANSLTQITTFTGTGNYGFGMSKLTLAALGNKVVWGHGGGTLGYISRVMYDPATKVSVCGISNYDQSSIDGTTALLLKVIMDFAPAPATTISGTKTVCQGQKSVVYSVAAITNAVSYIWTLPNGATGTSSTRNITVNYGANAVSGNITVKAVNTYGEGVPSSIAITVNATAKAGTVSTNLYNLCNGATINLTSTSYTGTLQWQTKTGSTWNNIGSVNTNPLNNVVVYGNTQFRAYITSSCGNDSSNILGVAGSNCANSIGNGNWNNAATWGSSIPGSGSNVLVNTSNIYINSSASCKNLMINTGDTLVINSGGNLIINGDLIVNGKLIMNAGVITFTKANTCIPSGTYHQLRVCASGNVYACGTITVNHDLEICPGTTFNDSGFVISAKANIQNNGTHATKNNGKIELVGSSMQTIYGTSGIYGNLDLNNSNGARLGANNSTTTPATINNTLRLVAGQLAINGNMLTIGSVSNSNGILLNPGNSMITATLPTSHIKFLGNANSAQITNLRISTPGSLTINLPNGVKLGAASNIYSSLTLTNGNINMNGNNLTIGNNNTSTGSISGTGKINNGINGGLLSLLGNGANAAYINLKFDTLFYIYLNNPAGAKLNNNCVVNGSAIINTGDVNLNGFTLTLGANATISEKANQTFYGNTGSISTTRNFLSALNNLNIGGLGIILSTSAAPGIATIVRGHKVYTNNGNSSMKRYFDITTANAVSATKFVITYDSSELNGNAYNNLRINSSNNNGLNWNNLSDCVPPASNTAIGSIGKYIGTVPLGSNTVKFTASDINHSLSPVFVNNNSIMTKGEATQWNNNIYTYPNPFTNEFTIELNVNAGIYMIQLTDLNGKSIYSQNIETTEGANKLNISTETLSKGIYILNVVGNEQKQMAKIVKQ